MCVGLFSVSAIWLGFLVVVGKVIQCLNVKLFNLLFGPIEGF